MNVRELAEQLLREIAEGTLDPEAIVVRPLCTCDEDSGLAEARYVDQVTRRFEKIPESEQALAAEAGAEFIPKRKYKHGSVEPGPATQKTVKLG